MATNARSDSELIKPVGTDDLLLRETHHRCNNDLQLIVSLLTLQSRRVTTVEAREALEDATMRVAVLARARAELSRQRHRSLDSAIRQVCEALQSQAEPRSVIVSMNVQNDVQDFAPDRTAALALVVNELITNAIKHAFQEGKGGHVSVSISQNENRETVIVVDDDGLPLPEGNSDKSGGIGLGIVRGLVESVGGILILPRKTEKRFQIIMPSGTLM